MAGYPYQAPLGLRRRQPGTWYNPLHFPRFPGDRNTRDAVRHITLMCAQRYPTLFCRGRDAHVPGYNKLNTLLPKLELMSPPVDSINLSSASVDLLVVTHAEWEIAYSSPKAIRPFDSHYGIVYKSSFLCRKVFLPFKNSLQEIPSVECLTT